MALTEGLLAKAGEGFVNDIYKSAKGKFKTEIQKFDWHTAQIHYYKKIENDYGFTRIIGKNEPISLEGIFTDVYLLDNPTAFQRFDITQLQNDFEKVKNDQNRLSGLELVKEGKLQRLYILGKPGAGKTTFLRYIALKASQSEIIKIPIFVSLYDWSKSGLELMPFLVKQFDICRFPDAQPLIEYVLKMGLAIVLFDGLDETKQEDGKREKIIDDIREFSRRYEESQILITCRIAASDYTFEEFTYVEVADFTEEQVEQYVEKWFSYDEEKQKNFKAEFDRGENTSLREMANTPLLLSLLCLNFEGIGTFPNRRVEIYEEGINALLSKWDSTRNIIRDEIYKGLSLGRKRQMFARIAAQNFEKNEYFLPKNKLTEMIVDYLSILPNAPPKEDIDGEVVLSAIEAQHSIFVERAHKIYSFSHLTFQEYFAAKYAVDNASSGTLKGIFSYKNLTNDRWEEVILNTVSLLDNADVFVDIVQSEINKYIYSDEKVIGFLKWANAKHQKMYPYSDNLFRAFYAYLEIILHRTSQIILENQYRFQDQSNEYIFGRGLMMGYLSSSHQILSNLKGIISDYTLNLIFDAEFVNLFTKSSKSSFHAELKLFVSKWQKNEADFQLNNESISKSIDEFSLLTKASNNKEVKETVENLLQIVRKYRDIGHYWNLTVIEEQKILQYLKTIRFLQKCLDLAVLSDRKKVEESFLLLSK